MPQYWLLKTEPSTYSFDDLERERTTTWDGIKNALALINLRAMHPGDGLLFYHSGKVKAVVGRGTVQSAPRTTGKVTVVDVRYEARLPAPVTLVQIKREPELAGLPLIRNTRLSVMPVTAEEWEVVNRLGEVGQTKG
jgi:predicted RNA-binding protein with PUA-like domain